MGRSMTAEAARQAFGAAVAGITPAAFEQYKLDRLLELRAVIEALRTEHSDELLADVRIDMGGPLA
jgi:hypothetical protein